LKSSFSGKVLLDSKFVSVDRGGLGLPWRMSLLATPKQIARWH